MSELLTCSEFRVLRAELAYKAMIARLPLLNAEIDALALQIRPIWKAMRQAKSKHEREKAYARLENDEDGKWQRLCFERDAIVKALAQLRESE
jgi:hypothetical protein